MAKVRTNRDKAWDIRADLNDKGYSDERILNELLANILSGDEAIRAMDLVAEELGEVEEYTEDEDFEDEDYNSSLLYGVDNNQ